MGQKPSRYHLQGHWKGGLCTSCKVGPKCDYKVQIHRMLHITIMLKYLNLKWINTSSYHRSYRMLFPTARKLFHCRQDPCIRCRKIYWMSWYTWMYILSLQFNWYFHEPTKDMSKVWNGKRGNYGHLQNLFLFGLQHLPNCQSRLHWRCQWWWLGSPIMIF